MFYALMRPSEVAALTKASCHLPEQGWVTSPSPTPAHRMPGLHRRRPGPRAPRPQGPHQRPAGPRRPQPVRKVPIPPELVELLRAHIASFGIAPGRQAVPVRDRKPDPALHLGGRSGRRSGPPRSPRPARLPADETPTTRATPGSPGGSTPASPPLRSPPGPVTPSRCSCASTPGASPAWKASGSAAWTKARTWRSHDLGRVWGAAPVTRQHPVAHRDQA